MFPDNTIQDVINQFEQTQKEVSTEVKLTSKFNYTNFQTSISDGSPEQINNIEAIKQWIILFILTPKDIYPIYEGTGFGTSLYKMRGQKKLFSSGYADSEIERELKEGLPLCPAIQQVTNFELDKDGRNLIVNVQVQLYDGTLVDVSVEDTFIIQRI